MIVDRAIRALSTSSNADDSISVPQRLGALVLSISSEREEQEVTGELESH